MRYFYLIGSSLIFMLLGCIEDPITLASYGAIEGIVLLEDSETPIEQARITTSPASEVIETDAEGKFVIDSIPVDAYGVRAEKTGYISELEAVNVEENKTTLVIFRMRPDTSGNLAPFAPYGPSPATDTDSINPQSTTLRWQCTDPNAGDDLTYNVYLYNENLDSSAIAAGITDTFVTLPILEFGRTYYWQVAASDPAGATTFGPVWSFETLPFPDLRYLYVRENASGYHIYADDANGFTAQLTSGTQNTWRPRMNPQRTKIAYLSNNGLETHVFLMDRDGSNQQQITTTPLNAINQSEIDFCWSPTGDKIMFPAFNKLYTINPDGSGLSLFAYAPTGYTFTECDWATSRIVARVTGENVYNSLILVYNTDGENIGQVLGDTPGGCGGLMFSPDGNKVLFTRDVSGFEAPDGRQLDSQIFLYDLTTESTTNLSTLKTPGTNDLDPRFSPDGAKVIFVNTNNDGISTHYILTVTILGLSRTQIFEDCYMPEWR